MFREFIDLTRTIQVVSGDYRQAWMDAKITGFRVEDSADPENEDVVEVSFGVEFEDGCTQWVQDIYGWNRNKWRYKDAVKPILSASGKPIPNDGHDLIYFSR